MNGQPVWLASLSRWTEAGLVVPVPRWSKATRMDAIALLAQTLQGVGDPARQRIFRMNVTICQHRAATDAEVETQPPWFRLAAGFGMAGGPVEVLWENVRGSASTRPCVAPRARRLPGATDPLLWVPQDCGRCAPCRARARVQPVTL